MDHWSFYAIIAYDRRGHEFFYDRPRSLTEFLVVLVHAMRRISRQGYRTRFKIGRINWYMRCRKLPWRPYA